MLGRQAMKTWMLTLTLAAGAAGTAEAATKGPDAFGYSANDRATYSFADIAGGGAASVLTGADDDQAQISLGFTFKFYGTSYTTVCVNANGFLTMGNCNASLAVANFANVDIASTAPQGNLPQIAVYWTDLTFATQGAGAVFYQTSGVTGARKFIVQWNQAYPQNGSTGVTFQAVLSEGANQILLQYANTAVNSNSFDRGGTATVGIRDASGQSNGNNLQWSYNSAVIASQTAIVFVPPSLKYQLSTSVNPAAAGSVAGAGQYAAGAVAQLTATANAGYAFAFWSGDVAGATNPVPVLMNGARNASANFSQTSGPPQLTLTQGVHRDGVQAGTRVAPMTIGNAGPGVANNAQIVSITNITTSVGTGAVTLASSMPVTVGTLAAGQNAVANVVFNWPASVTRVTMKITFGANAGGYVNSATVAMFR